jgi:hypothetical protein
MSTSSIYIYNKVTKEFELDNKDTCCQKVTTIIPVIKNICKIPVSAEIIIIKQKDDEHKYKFVFLIESSKILKKIERLEIGFALMPINLFVHSKEFNDFNVELIDGFLLEVKNILSKLKFNKLLGTFIPEGEINDDSVGLDIFSDKYMNVNECCVCLEKTSITTDCSHSLCVECWSSLKSNKCPVCRNTNIVVEDDLINLSSDSESNENIEESDNESFSESDSEFDDEIDDEIDNNENNEDNVDKSEPEDEDEIVSESEHELETESESEHESEPESKDIIEITKNVKKNQKRSYTKRGKKN